MSELLNPPEICKYPGFTDQMIAFHIEEINRMGHHTLCHLWRYATPGHIYFDKQLPFYEVFHNRLFKHFGGFTSEISKELS